MNFELAKTRRILSSIKQLPADLVLVEELHKTFIDLVQSVELNHAQMETVTLMLSDLIEQKNEAYIIEKETLTMNAIFTDMQNQFDSLNALQGATSFSKFKKMKTMLLDATAALPLVQTYIMQDRMLHWRTIVDTMEKKAQEDGKAGLLEIAALNDSINLELQSSRVNFNQLERWYTKIIELVDTIELSSTEREKVDLMIVNLKDAKNAAVLLEITTFEQQVNRELSKSIVNLEEVELLYTKMVELGKIVDDKLSSEQSSSLATKLVQVTTDTTTAIKKQKAAIAKQKAAA